MVVYGDKTLMIWEKVNSVMHIQLTNSRPVRKGFPYNGAVQLFRNSDILKVLIFELNLYDWGAQCNTFQDESSWSSWSY